MGVLFFYAVGWDIARKTLAKKKKPWYTDKVCESFTGKKESV